MLEERVGSKHDTLEMLEQMGYIHFLACISLPNEDNIAFHTKRGYQQVAHFPKIIYKFNRWHDTLFGCKVMNKHAGSIKHKRNGVEMMKKTFINNSSNHCC